MQDGACEVPPTYRLIAGRGLALAQIGLLELLEPFPGAHLPEPFDIVNHAGNVGPSVPLAMAGCMLYAYRNPETRPGDFEVSAADMSKFRKFGVAAVSASVGLINCITETKWGIQHIPVISELAGTPDPLDAIYGTAAAVLTSLLIWRKVPGRVKPKSYPWYAS